VFIDPELACQFSLVMLKPDKLVSQAIKVMWNVVFYFKPHLHLVSKASARNSEGGGDRMEQCCWN